MEEVLALYLSEVVVQLVVGAPAVFLASSRPLRLILPPSV